MTTEQANATAAEAEFDVIGTRPIRHDGPDKVTGRARYAADIHPPGWLVGKVLRSPHAHAIIRSIDATRVLAIPGVKAVVTAADFPEVSAEIADQEEGATVNYGFYSRNVMAREKALYCGHAVAAVAATSAGAADQALAALDVDYEVLPPVLNADDAMREGAPLLHDRLVTLANPNMRQGGWGDAGETPSNVSNRFEFSLGDPDGRVRPGRRDCGAGVPHPPGTSRLHRAALGHGAVEYRWQRDHLGQQPKPFRPSRPYRRYPRRSMCPA